MDVLVLKPEFVLATMVELVQSLEAIQTSIEPQDLKNDCNHQLGKAELLGV